SIIGYLFLNRCSLTFYIFSIISPTRKLRIRKNIPSFIKNLQRFSPRGTRVLLKTQGGFQQKIQRFHPKPQEVFRKRYGSFNQNLRRFSTKASVVLADFSVAFLKIILRLFKNRLSQLVISPHHHFQTNFKRRCLMALKYRLLQKRNPQNPQLPGKVYAQAITKDEVDFRQLAQQISAISTVSVIDIVGVIEAFVQLIPRHLTQGEIIRLGDFGSFALGIFSEGVEVEKILRKDNQESQNLLPPGKGTQKILAQIEFEKEPRVSSQA
ncbi:hypothetical protein L0244_09380, partial [bacterium]|nr:hypothetical protein [bacterium]